MMGNEWLIIIGPIAYIILWIYSLITFSIPVLSLNLLELGTLLIMPLWQIAYLFLFFTVGVWLLVISAGVLLGIVLTS